MRKNPSIVFALLALLVGLSAGSARLAVADNTTTGQITGIAVDADGKGIAGVSVTVHTPGDNPKTLVTATTDDKGAFTLEVPAPASDLVVDLKQDLKPLPTSATRSGVAVEPGKTTDLGKIEMKIG
jgi:hypothetical protein